MSDATVVTDFLLEAGYSLERAKVAVKALTAKRLYAVALTHVDDEVPVPQASFYTYREADAYAKELREKISKGRYDYASAYMRLCNTKMNERKFQEAYSALVRKHVLKFKRTEVYPSSFDMYSVGILEFPAP